MRTPDQDLEILRRAVALVSASTELEATLRATLDAFLPALGDFGFFDAVLGDEVVRTAGAHEDPVTQALLEPTRWTRQERADLNLCALSSGRSALHAGIDDAWYRDIAFSEEHLGMMRRLAFRSMLTVPMVHGGELLGALTLFMARSGREHGSADVALAQDLAAVAAPVVANARLLAHGRSTEAALRRSETRLQFVMDSMQQKIFTATPSGDVDYFNPAWMEFTGLSFEAIRDWGWLEFIHPDDVEENKRAWSEAVATAQPFRLEHRFRRADGEYRWHLSRAFPMLDDAGRVTLWIGSNTEIHEVKQAGEALRESRAELEAERIRLQTIIDTIPTGLIMLGPNGELQLENTEWKRTWARGELTEPVVDYDSYKGFRPDTGERIPSDQWPCARSLKEGVQTRDVVLDIERFDGRRGTIVVSSAPILDEGGHVVGAVAANMDITELRDAQARLQDADRRKDEFLAMLAHELRNPLAPIGTASQILRRGAHEPDRVVHSAGVIERQVQHLTRLVDDLLDVSRVTRGQVTIVREPVDIRSVVSAALEQVQPLVHARGHEMHSVSSTGELVVEGDFNRLVQVVVNLLTNAAKYTPQGGRIEVHARREDSMVCVRVTDSGVGISPALLPRVFDLFTQAERTPDRTQGGLGIGLALARSLVGLHGGAIEARSDGANRGSSFLVRLPAALVSTYRHTPRLEPAAARPRRILIVDDNRDAADTLAELLGLFGHDVQVAGDGASALAIATEKTWDACVLDIGLPDMTGLELVQRLKEGPNGHATFIALTGYGQSHDRALSRAAGFDHHMVKPPDITRLVSIL